MWERQGPENQGVHHAERHSVRPDSERQCHDRRDGKARSPAHHSQRVLQIPPSVVEPCERASVSVCLFGLRHAAEAAERRTARFSRRQTLPDVFLDGLLEMRGNLLAQVAIQLTRVKQPAQACQKDTQPSHDTFSRTLKKRATIPVACCHATSSARSCLRPALVNV